MGFFAVIWCCLPHRCKHSSSTEFRSDAVGWKPLVTEVRVKEEQCYPSEPEDAGMGPELERSEPADRERLVLIGSLLNVEGLGLLSRK